MPLLSARRKLVMAVQFSTFSAAKKMPAGYTFLRTARTAIPGAYRRSGGRPYGNVGPERRALETTGRLRAGCLGDGRCRPVTAGADRRRRHFGRVGQNSGRQTVRFAQ